MSKTKSSILLLISLFIINCSLSNNLPKNNNKYSLEYIGEGYDGLVLKKQLTYMLRGFRSFDQDSKKTIKADINHETEIFDMKLDLMSWPDVNHKLLEEEEIELPIQIKGKLASTLKTKKGYQEDDIMKLIYQIDKIKAKINGKKVIKVINVQDKIINIITN